MELPYPWLAAQGPCWIAGDAARVHENPYFSVDAYAATAPTGAPAAYYVIDPKAVATGVLPLHEDGTVTLVGQWRFPFGTYSWEMPEGGAPKAEAPLDGAKRELAEEAGLQAANWREVLRMHLANSSSTELAILYLATDLSPCKASTEDATEDLAKVRVPFSEALAAVAGGHILDSLTVAMLLRVHHMAVIGELDPVLARAVLG